MRPVLVKVYGFLRPVSRNELAELREALALVDAEAGEVLTLNGELMNISYEGTFFPLDDFLLAAAPMAQRGCHGKIDYLDLEAWKLRRYICENGSFQGKERDLNSVMEYSGH